MNTARDTLRTERNQFVHSSTMAEEAISKVEAKFDVDLICQQDTSGGRYDYFITVDESEEKVNTNTFLNAMDDLMVELKDRGVKHERMTEYQIEIFLP